MVGVREAVPMGTGATEAVILDSTFIVQNGLEFKQVGKARAGGAGTGQQITVAVILANTWAKKKK